MPDNESSPPLTRGGTATADSSPDFTGRSHCNEAFTTPVADQVADHTLPTELADLADRYENTIGLRERFVWKWFHLLNPSFTLSSVDQQYEPKVQDDKTYLTFYITLVDDLLETRGDKQTFEQAAKLPFKGQTADFGTDGVDTAYLDLTADVWKMFEKTATTAPNFEELAEVFYYDLRQALNAIRYSYVVSEHVEIANLTEAYAYGSHNMVMFPYADIDLMHSSAFDRSEFSELRKFLRQAQEMARIGNWISTWERELDEGDYGAGVVIHALESGLVTPEELFDTPNSTQEASDDIHAKLKNAGIEDFFLQEWSDRYSDLAQTADIESIDTDAFLNGMKTVLWFHLGTRGMK